MLICSNPEVTESEIGSEATAGSSATSRPPLASISTNGDNKRKGIPVSTGAGAKVNLGATGCMMICSNPKVTKPEIGSEATEPTSTADMSDSPSEPESIVDGGKESGGTSIGAGIGPLFRNAGGTETKDALETSVEPVHTIANSLC